ncbi:pyridoxamine 5'-phosphate oxidase [Desulforhopalus singaporensis]|uniref:Pyridoxamine 5'-phosphate oxidase n=1 Tax=Desulforhopalus singaporensis TaxID=91360 RepID=A0A1H0UIK2_9BACT|nr:pyridoxamine 5'-phosphate oxidase [Desulforhopalus singaporensis]SDP65696.1 Pyridoxamine 5'-phosphate oxidase [Desulforhopalus singaporensis]
MDLSQFRREYLKGGLSRSDLKDDPVVQFSDWFSQARETDIADPTAMILATVSRNGMPSQRTVLLKYFDESGFVFFTNFGSRKALEIKENQKVSLLFPWLDLERQVMVNGIASKISTAESAKYFMSRPRESQMAAWVSSQSNTLSSRAMLLQKFNEMKRKIGEKKVPLPTFWGGFRVKPLQIEFWQGRKSRLHDRFLYSLDETGKWSVARLAP